ncbi:hypothetical protein CHS0354_029460 [Potamilus streckersoni]|uniref:START domain-containing protein n=1 Tax=Potamilus streckersoni TaxID=2493646 RepID=A0AAE0SUE1_9BIVA|nr:hypothetical protein CHS0354_029460 [Potamilus streckersoni]
MIHLCDSIINKMYLLIISVVAVIISLLILGILKYISISKMRIDDRDNRRKLILSAFDVLSMLRNLKPFPVGTYKGWKLYSFHHGSRVWCKAVTPNTGGASMTIYGAFHKVKISPQVILQILKDVSRNASWKPGVVATSITSKPTEYDLAGSRPRGTVGGTPVQHDIISEEIIIADQCNWATELCRFLGLSSYATDSMPTVTKEYKRFWHREDNGVCWVLQMNEIIQEWIFILAQPSEEVDHSLLSVMCYMDLESSLNNGANRVAELIGSLKDYIQHRRLQATPVIDIKLPLTSKHEKKVRSYSSSEDNAQKQTAGNRMLQRFRSLVVKPVSSCDTASLQFQLQRSASILRHRLQSKSNSDGTTLVSKKEEFQASPQRTKVSEVEGQNQGKTEDKINAEVIENNNIIQDLDRDEMSKDNTQNFAANCIGDFENIEFKNLDKTLDEDIMAYEEETIENPQDRQQSSFKKGLIYVVKSNQAAAEILSVALQVSYMDLSQSLAEQKETSGGWMFCGMDHEVVILKKTSPNGKVTSYLGKGIINAPPKTVWETICNPQTRFTYDDSLKKVDVVQTITDSVKIVYYYHEIQQLFKKECYDMYILQSERVDGEKFVLAMQSVERGKHPEAADYVVRIELLPSGWIIEPFLKEKRVFSMVTYLMQVNFSKLVDKTPLEDLVSKQPLSIAYLRQYLPPTMLWSQKP